MSSLRTALACRGGQRAGKPKQSKLHQRRATNFLAIAIIAHSPAREEKNESATRLEDER